MGWLEGKVALITGGGSGIGRALVERFLEKGASVFGVLECLVDKAKELQSQFGDNIVVVQGDVTQLEDNERAVAETVGAFGKLDTFIGNAGILRLFCNFTEFTEGQVGPNV